MPQVMVKPTVKLIGEDGNVFILINRAMRALEKAGMDEEAEELTRRSFDASSYDEVLQLIMQYCEVV